MFDGPCIQDALGMKLMMQFCKVEVFEQVGVGPGTWLGPQWTAGLRAAWPANVENWAWMRDCTKMRFGRWAKPKRQTNHCDDGELIDSSGRCVIAANPMSGCPSQMA